MNIFLKFTCLLVLATSLFSCQKEEPTPLEIPILPAIQYPVDLANIEKFMNEYSMNVTSPDIPNNIEGYDVTFTKITDPATQPSIMNQTTYPVQNIVVNNSGVNYKLYYINFRQGVGNKPSAVDSLFVSYKGDYLANSTEIVAPATTATTFIKPFLFENTPNPIWLDLFDRARQVSSIEGWKEIFPIFQDGTFTDGVGGDVVYSNFGAGVMFLPSFFGYYNKSQGPIPKYSPLIFSFKLKKTKYKDHDRDRILSKDEDLNGDGFFNNDDTDGDGIYNYEDTDDDGDGFVTKDEIRKPSPLSAGQGTSAYYPFNPIMDNPLTPTIDESEPKGIPDASGDGTTSTRIRRHLDKNSKPPFLTY